MEIKVGTKCIMAIGFTRNGSSKITISPKKIVKVTKVTSKGYHVGSSEFDFNHHEKVKHGDYKFAVAIPVTNFEAKNFNDKRKEKIKRVKLMLKEKAVLERKLKKLEDDINRG